MPPTLNDRLASPWTDELGLSALARRLLRPEQRAMRFDAYGREAPLEEQMMSPHDIAEMERAQFGGIAVRLLPPKVLYHGSRSAENLRTLQSPRSPISAWFAEEKALPLRYGPTLYRPQRPVELRRPLILTKDMNKTATLDDIRKDSGLNFPTPTETDMGQRFPRWGETQKVKRWQVVTSPEFVEAAKAAGYDGVRVTEGGHMTWGLFQPTEVIPPGVRQQRAPRPAPGPVVPKAQMDFWGRGETPGGPPTPLPPEPPRWRVF